MATLNEPHEPATGPADTHAPGDEAVSTLRSGTLVTRYRRWGTGSPVLVLADAASRPGGIDVLCRVLARDFRVVRPEAPQDVGASGGSGDPRSAAWLRELVDGLGLDRCAVVAEGSFIPAATWFALSDPVRARRLVLLIPEPHDPRAPLDDMRDRLVASGRPVLVVRVEPSTLLPNGALERVVAFLSEPDTTG